MASGSQTGGPWEPGEVCEQESYTDIRRWRAIPEAASVVEPPISQVPLHEVNMLAADPTAAADRAARRPQSLQGGVRTMEGQLAPTASHLSPDMANRPHFLG